MDQIEGLLLLHRCRSRIGQGLAQVDILSRESGERAAEQYESAKRRVP